MRVEVRYKDPLEGRMVTRIADAEYVEVEDVDVAELKEKKWVFRDYEVREV